MVHRLSSLEGTFTAESWVLLCLPDGNATIFMNGTLSAISLNFKAF